jgi:hypothetical protein
MRLDALVAQRDHDHSIAKLQSPDAEETFEQHYLRKGIRPETFERRIKKARYLHKQIRKDHMLEHYRRAWQLRNALFKNVQFIRRGQLVKAVVNRQGRFVGAKALTPNAIHRYALRVGEKLAHVEVLRAGRKVEKKLLREARGRAREKAGREAYLRRLLAREIAKGGF